MGSDVALTWSCLGGYANAGPRERVERRGWLLWKSAEDGGLGSRLPGSPDLSWAVSPLDHRQYTVILTSFRKIRLLGFFFFPVLKLSPASQTGGVLPELLSRMSFTGKT